MDVFTKEKRSEVMSLIRNKGNKQTELRLVKLLRERGIRGWRRGSKLPGHPDFVFSRARLAVFVDGCFWHGCPKHCRIPKTQKKFWHEKIETNKKRDRKKTRELKKLGWRVMRIWQHSLRTALVERTIARLLRMLGPLAWEQSAPAVQSRAVGGQKDVVYPEPPSFELIAAEDE